MKLYYWSFDEHEPPVGQYAAFANSEAEARNFILSGIRESWSTVEDRTWADKRIAAERKSFLTDSRWILEVFDIALGPIDLS